MKDGIIKGEGNSRLLKAPGTIPNTFAEFRTALINGTLPVDVLFNAAGWEVVGTLLGKSTLLNDAVADALGLTSDDPTVNEAINALLTVATSVRNGLMSAADKAKLDGVAEGANNYTHPTTAGNKHIPAGGATNQILQYSSAGTATWQDLLASEMGLSSAVAALFGVSTVDEALKMIPPKQNIAILTSSGTWTPPRANMYIDVFMISGGGGGGGGNQAGSSDTCGGGGGYVKILKDYRITSTAAIAVVIGTGGVGGALASNGVPATGGNGGVTSFAGISTVKAGQGGTAGNSTNNGAPGGDGGAGGGAGLAGFAGGSGATGYGGDGATPSTLTSGGVGVFDSTPGAYCLINKTLYGGAGGAGGGATSGTSGSGKSGGAGGTGGGGAGGAGGKDANAIAGYDATNRGAGGGGGGSRTGSSSYSAAAGGAGMAGVIVIAY